MRFLLAAWSSVPLCILNDFMIKTSELVGQVYACAYFKVSTSVGGGFPTRTSVTPPPRVFLKINGILLYCLTL